MTKKKAKKRARKKISPMEKIRKELDKLEALHEKESDVVEKITDILDEDELNEEEEASDGGTDPN